MDGRPYAVDFGAIMTMGTALQVDQLLLASVLPAFERIIVDAICGDDSDTQDQED